MKFENIVLAVFYAAVGVVFLIGGWIVALVFFLGWLPMFAIYLGIKMIVGNANHNWGAGKVPHRPISPHELRRK